MPLSPNGTGAALETTRPQEPGGCVKSPEAEARYLLVDRFRKASFLGQALVFLMIIYVGRHEIEYDTRGRASRMLPNRT